MIIQEQEDILNEKNVNMIVSASAGSGKTTVMIRKILKYIIDGDCHTDELLVLTYTNAAAQEMKKKLIEKLKDNINEHPFLQEELEMAAGADVETIDSFCQKIVKKYFYAINIDPSFGILEEGEQTYYKEQAISSAIFDMKKNNPALYEMLLESLSAKRDDKNIKDIVLKIYTYVTSLLDIDEFFETTLKLYDPNTKIAEEYLNTHYNNRLLLIKEELDELKLRAVGLEFNSYVKYISNLLSIIDALMLQNNFKNKVDYLDFSYGTLYKCDDDEIGLKEEISSCKDRLKNTIDELKAQFISADSITLSYKFCGELIKGVISLVKLFEEKYKEEKRQINSFDFNDIERLCIKVLENPNILQEIKDSYKYIFIDEFQDANKIQEKIIFTLEKNNLFFVGDTKQSIYGFRQSDPEIFINTEKKFKKQEGCVAKKLNCNFRTNKHILEFINQIFSQIMTVYTCSLNYKKDAQFEPKAEYPNLDGEVCVELDLVNPILKKSMLLEAGKVYDLELANNNTSNGSFSEQCNFIGNKIIELLGQKYYDKESDQIKEIGLKDITILISKRDDFLHSLTKALEEVNIPFVVNANDNLEECYDSEVFYNLMKYALNRCDDYGLYCVISSKLFNFSDSELALIRQCGAQKENFYECVDCYSNNDEISQKLAQFKTTIDNFLYDLKFKGIYYSLNKIVKQTKYLLNISDEEDFNQRQTNVLNYIESFNGSRFNYSVYDYITYRDTATRANKVQTDKNFVEAVQITTIHSSKGLEYPVVIIPNLNQEFLRENYTTDIKINKKLGIGIKNFNSEDRTKNSGIFYNACRLLNREYDLSEKIRLLYVATTRVKNRLILVGNNTQKFKKITSGAHVLRAKTYLDLIVGSLPVEQIKQINSGKEFTDSLFGDGKNMLSVEYSTSQDINATLLNIPKEVDMPLAKQIAEFLKVDLSSRIRPIALKNSVSRIALEDYASSNLAPSNFYIKEHLNEKLSDIGTLYHSLLEKANFLQINTIQDLTYFIECNFSGDEVNIFKKIGYENILKNIELLKNECEGSQNVLKEQKFLMSVPHCEVAGGDAKDKIIIQGVIDLLIIKSNKIILIDYKQSHKTNELLQKTYSRQLLVYEMAIKKRFKNFPVEKKILNLVKNEFINLN